MKYCLPVICFLIGLTLNGCGSDSAQAPTAPTITSQPANMAVLVGNSATFSVAATGTGPLTYQWYWNGMVISNATGSSITLPPAVQSDNQTTLSVTVTNQQGSVTSTAATLSVPDGTRPANAWDLRFKDIGAFPVYLAGGGISANILPGTSSGYTNGLGLSFNLGSTNDESWMYTVYGMPSGIPGRMTTFSTGALDQLPSDFSTLSHDPSVIITSLNVVAGQNAYAIETVKTALNDAYTPAMEGAVLPADLQAIATSAGLTGEVITAVSLSGGQAYFVGYGRRGDTTVYDSKVVLATVDNVNASAMSLSAQGYFLTAIGGDIADGFILVGTKVHGDTTPREFAITYGSSPWPGRGFTPLVNILDYQNVNWHFFQR